MRTSLALGRASSASAAIELVQPDEFEYNFSNKSADANLHGNTSDSGHTMQVVGTGTAIIKDAGGGEMVYCADSPASNATYLTTASPMDHIVYMWGRFRFVHGSATTIEGGAALIPFTTVDPSTADSGAHIIFLEDEGFAQVVTNGVVSGSGAPTLAYADTGEGWVEGEFAIDGDACVIRDPDGTTWSYEHAQLASDIGVYPVFEVIQGSTDWRPQFSHIKASSLVGMNAAQLAYFNALLATEGYGPA